PGTHNQTLTDSARVTAADQADHVPANNRAAASLRVQSADLGVSLAVDDSMPNEGRPVTFTVTVTNHGPDAASHVALTDHLPAGLTLNSATPSHGSYLSVIGAWNLGNLATGASATLALRATVLSG